MKTNATDKNDCKQSQNKAVSRTSIGKKDRDTLRERAKIVKRGPSNSAEVCAAVNQIKESGHYRNDSDTWDDYCVRFFDWPAADVERFTELYRADRWSEVTYYAPSAVAPSPQPCDQSPVETPSVAAKVSASNQTEPSGSIKLPIHEIIVDDGLQCREKLDEATVKRYAVLMNENPQALPPPKVVKIGERYVLADGFHRRAAAERLKWETMLVYAVSGTRADAIQLAVKENASHGLPLNGKDKKRAITLVLNELPGMSDRALAELCGASHTSVRKVRAQLETVSSSPATREGKDGRRRKLPKRKPTKSAATGTQTDKAATQEPSSAQTDGPNTSAANTREEENPELYEPSVEDANDAYDISKRLAFLRDTFSGEIERCPVKSRNKLIDDIVDFVVRQRPDSERS